MDDDAKRRILARRAKFVAAAIAGIAATSCDDCNKPRTCLSATAVTVPPGPCLSVPVTVDAGEQTAIDAGGGAADAGDAGDAGAAGAGKDAGKKVVGPPPPPPQPCLSQVPPQPCLKPPPPQVCLEPPF